MQLTKNFKKEEFDSKDGAEMPKDVLENIKLLAKYVQLIRNEVVITLINIPKFERNSQLRKQISLTSLSCNYFDKYTKI